MINLKKPYLLFLGDAENKISAKTSIGIADFNPESCLGFCKHPDGKVKIDKLPELSIAEAKKQGAKTFIVGLANSGGFIDENWVPYILEAIEAGMDIASGLHKKLEDVEAIKVAAKKHNVSLYNVRYSTADLKTGKGAKRTGKRILTVGTDCSVGKMYSSMILERALKEKGKKTHFVATGQTGILISGSGISVDAVVADFIAGAVEMMTPSISDDEYYIIEGQGSLFHPSFAGVSLGLLHGSAPDYLVMCTEPNRPHMRGVPDYTLPDLKTCIERNILMGSLTNPNIKCIGISCNTSAMEESEAQDYLNQISSELNLPATDPFRFGVDKIVEKLCQEN